MNKKNRPLIVCVAVEILFLIFFHCIYSPYVRHTGVLSREMWVESDRMISSVELNSQFLQWKEVTGQRVSVSNQFAYVKVEIENESPIQRSYLVLNRDINTYIKFMEFRKFQMYPLKRSFEHSSRPAVRVSVLPGSKKTVFMELRNSDVIAVSPLVLDENDFYNQGWAEQFFLWTLTVLTAFLSLNFIAEFFVLKNKYLLISGLISVIIVFGYMFSTSLVFHDYDGRSLFMGRRYLLKFWDIAFLFGTVILFFEYIRHYNDFFGSQNLQTTVISFVPWLLFESISLAGSLLRVRIFYEHITLLSWFLSMMTFGIFIVRSFNISQEEEQAEILSYFTLTSKISFRELLHAKTVPSQVLVKVRDRLQQPLEIIQTIASLAGTTTDLSKIVSYSVVISDYVIEMKKILGLELSMQEETDFLQTVDSDETKELPLDADFSQYQDQTLCIYGSDDDIVLSEKIILNGDGFYCVTISSYEDIEEGIKCGAYQMLIINPATDGAEVFNLCQKIRENYNVFQFPILMVINYYANHLVRQGYSVGVNDFIIRPFDSSELTSRCCSLLRQKNIFNHNQQLIKHENEKNAFLYFVTHNVNTPLTLLLNRVEELSNYDTEFDGELHEIFCDVQEAVNEINEIIQNVLISFRISDGRFVNVTEHVFVEDILDAIRPAMESKAASHDVELDWRIQDILPQVNCNKQALRGIITNLVDNAIKYSPERGTVTIKVSQEPVPLSELEGDDVQEDLKKYGGNRIVLSVSDEGDGVPSSRVPYLFSRFEPQNNENADANRPSVGLGLYVANELSKLNKIRLEYSDAVEGGACFTMYFPPVASSPVIH